MSDDRQKLVLGERKGMPFYGANPSIPERGTLQTTRSRPKKIANGRDAMIIHPSSGEVLGKASVAFMEVEDVDSQRFVKLYVEGVSRITGLKAAGVRVRQRPARIRVCLGRAGVAARTLARFPGEPGPWTRQAS